MPSRPVLVFGYGNPCRGDDGLGPALIERLESLLPHHPEWPDADLLTDFQLQVENALDIQGRERMLFVDASVDAPAPYSFSRIHPKACDSALSHAISPQEVLRVYEQVCGVAAPSFLLAIKGETFDLGEPLSDKAVENLTRAVAFAERLLARHDAREWQAFCDRPY